MISKRYFSHQFPTGAGPPEVVSASGYDFITVGENLALGVFKNEQDLIDAWMASPGHKENILNKEWREIGVAVVIGKYEGVEEYFAVQEFGTPASVCPKPSASLKQNLEN